MAICVFKFFSVKLQCRNQSFIYYLYLFNYNFIIIKKKKRVSSNSNISRAIVEVVGVRWLHRWKWTEFNPRALNAIYGSSTLSIGVERVDEFFLPMPSGQGTFTLLYSISRVTRN